MAQTQTAPGIANANPSPETTTEKIQWIDIDEMEKYEKLISRRYVRKDNPEDAKKYFYKITGMHPYQPANTATLVCSEEQNLYKFEVQKYHRNKFTTTTKRDEGMHAVEARDHLPVDMHEMRRGRWVCVDNTASTTPDVREFLKNFQPDNE